MMLKIQEENILNESVEPDTNSDIIIEYYSGHDKKSTCDG